MEVDGCVGIPVDIQTAAIAVKDTVRELQMAVFQNIKTGLQVRNRAVVLSGLEPRKSFCLLLSRSLFFNSSEEVLVGAIHYPRDILQYLGMNIAELGEGFLQFGFLVLLIIEVHLLSHFQMK